MRGRAPESDDPEFEERQGDLGKRPGPGTHHQAGTSNGVETSFGRTRSIEGGRDGRAEWTVMQDAPISHRA
jgi:hypothetical protein